MLVLCEICEIRKVLCLFGNKFIANGTTFVYMKIKFKAFLPFGAMKSLYVLLLADSQFDWILASFPISAKT